MIARFRRADRGDDGAAAVEFALVLPLLLITVFGIITFGLMLFTLITAQHSAREAARQAVVGNFTTCSGTSAPTDLKWFVSTDLGLDPAVVTNLSMSRTGSNPGDQLTISFDVPTDEGMSGALAGALNLVPGASFVLPESFTVTADSRVEVVGSLVSCDL